MSKKKALGKDYQKLLDDAGFLLTKDANSQLGENEWITAYIDVRLPTEGGFSSSLEKSRAVLARTAQNVPLDSSMEVTKALAAAYAIAAQSLLAQWYGIRLTVRPTGTCEVVYDYNPKCIADPTFFDD